MVTFNDLANELHLSILEQVQFQSLPAAIMALLPLYAINDSLESRAILIEHYRKLWINVMCSHLSSYTLNSDLEAKLQAIVRIARCGSYFFIDVDFWGQPILGGQKKDQSVPEEQHAVRWFYQKALALETGQQFSRQHLASLLFKTFSKNVSVSLQDCVVGFSALGCLRVVRWLSLPKFSAQLSPQLITASVIFGSLWAVVYGHTPVVKFLDLPHLARMRGNMFLVATPWVTVNSQITFGLPGCFEHIEFFQENQTVLHLACARDHLEITQLLIDKGADLEAIDNKGRTSLHLGCGWHTNNLNIAQLLINCGANIHAQDHEGQTPLHHASVAKVQLLMNCGANIDAQDRYSRTPLHLACMNANPDKAHLLMNRGANIHVRDHQGLTPLHFASRKGLIEVVRSLREKGADLKAMDNAGLTPLHCTCLEYGIHPGHLAVAQYLTEHGADCMAMDNEGLTPLHWACSPGSVEVAQFLRTKGANIHAKAHDGSTPLHLACRSGHFEAAQWLIDQGVNIDAKDHEGGTPLHVACAVSSGPDSAAVRLLIEKGADVNQGDHEGRRPLHRACLKDCVESVQWLIFAGAALNLRDNDGQTPFHYACLKGYRRMIEFLINHGANIYAQDDTGQTPLALACSKGHLEIAQLLRTLLSQGTHVKALINDVTAEAGLRRPRSA